MDNTNSNRVWKLCKLVERGTGRVVESGLNRVVARDKQNHYWIEGVKTDVVEED